MQGDSALRCFDRSHTKIRIMILKLMKQLGYHNVFDEMMMEVQEKFVENFYEKYETDNQYLRYIFIVMKNRMKDLRFKMYRYTATHLSVPPDIGDPEDCNLIRIWNEMAEDTREEAPLDAVIVQDFVSQIHNKLIRDLHKKIFLAMVEGKPPKKIAEELGYSVGHIGQVRANHIWPVVKDIMKIPEDKYDMLIDSCRIYCR